jgi:hypothetical protein
MLAKVALGSACLACPATALIQPSPAIVFTPSQSALPVEYMPLPGAFIPGLDSFGIPPAWSVGMGFAPTEEAASAPPAFGAFASALWFIAADNNLDTVPSLAAERASNAGMFDTGAGSVTTGNSSVPEPAGLWVLGIGLSALGYARLSVLLARHGAAAEC